MKAVRHFGIVVSDMEKSLYFYRDLLGLEVKKDIIEKGNFIDTILGIKDVKVRTVKMSADDGNIIELLCYKSHVKKSREDNEFFDIGASHPAFTVENIDEEYKRLKEKETKFSCPPQVSPDGRAKVTFCYDPDGVPVELVEILK